jgi:hypothetical protein
MELLGSAPISRLSAPSTMGLELGSLPSTGVTRLPRYYEPLRHPKRPGLALAGIRSSSRDSPLGASRVASDLRVRACHRPYPGGTPGACRVVRGNPSVSRDDGLPRIATGSAPTSACFGACTAFTVVAACPLAEPPEAARGLEGFDGLVTSTAAPIATGWSDQLSGRESHPLEIRALARRTAIGTPRRYRRIEHHLTLPSRPL